MIIIFKTFEIICPFFNSSVGFENFVETSPYLIKGIVSRFFDVVLFCETPFLETTKKARTTSQVKNFKKDTAGFKRFKYFLLTEIEC